jgi:LCP family protein required for cell wall assembly
MTKNRYKFKRLIPIVLLLPAILGCGASSAINPQTSTPTGTATATPTRTPTLTPTLTPTPTEIPAVCGGPRVMHILLIGSDARRDNYTTGLADAIRLVRVDFVEPGIRLLAFPRDLYMEIPGIANRRGITHGKLNQAYVYGNPGYDYYDGPDQGPGLLAATLESNFGVRTHHYVAVNIQTFVRIVDALGGINIDLPYVIDGRVPRSKDSNRYFPAGNQHLNGYRTMLLARMRPQGDFRRMEIQNLILLAIAQRLSSPAMIARLPDLIKSFYGSVQTDLDPLALGQLACLAGLLDDEKIEFVEFPVGLFTVSRVHDPVLGYTSVLDADFGIMKEYVRKFQAGAPFIPEGDQE